MVEYAYDFISSVGHENVLATHASTLEITKDGHVTRRGNCVIGILASKSAAELREDLKKIIRSEGSVVVLFLSTPHSRDVVIARGSPDLRLTNRKSIVVRKSSYIDDRTVAILANKSAGDLDRKLVEDLRGGLPLHIIIVAVRFPGGPGGIRTRDSGRGP